MGNWVGDFLSGNGLAILYLGTFVVLVICGLGVPIPEEATFLAAGYAASKFQIGNVELALLCAVGVFGIIVGDSAPFYIGRHYGMSFLKHRFFAKIMTPDRIARVEVFFRRHGPKAVFFGRFVAGLRMPTFFMAASMGVRYRTFVFWDLMGALISCPTSILVAYWFGAKAEKIMAESKLYAVLGVAIIGIIAYIAFRLHHRPHAAPADTANASGGEQILPENPHKSEQAEVRR